MRHVRRLTEQSDLEVEFSHKSIRHIPQASCDLTNPAELEEKVWKPSRKMVDGYTAIHNEAREQQLLPTRKKHLGLDHNAAGVTSVQVSRERRPHTHHPPPSGEMRFRPNKRQHHSPPRDPVLVGDLIPPRPEGVRIVASGHKLNPESYDIFPQKPFRGDPAEMAPPPPVPRRVAPEQTYRRSLRRPEGLDKFEAVQDHTSAIARNNQGGPVDDYSTRKQMARAHQQSVGAASESRMENRQMYELYRARNTRPMQHQAGAFF